MGRPADARQPGLALYAEPRASHRFDRRGGPDHLDMCRALPPEEADSRERGLIVSSIKVE